MNWGYRVVIILVVFVIGIGVMVYIAMQQTNEMMDDNYYDKEMKYQGIIDAKKNTGDLNDSVQVTTQDSLVRIRLPLPAIKKLEHGSIEFLRPSDQTKDKTVELKVDSNGLQFLPRTDFIKGLYRIRAKWNSNGISYYDERDVILN